MGRYKLAVTRNAFHHHPTWSHSVNMQDNSLHEKGRTFNTGTKVC